MKKLLSVILIFAMLLSTFAPFASAQEPDNNRSFSELLSSASEDLPLDERLKQINNPYKSFDLNLFEDFFATEEDLANENWDNTSTAESSNILAYKGFAYSNYSNRYPMDAKYEATSTANVTAFRTSLIESTTGITKEADGSYTYTIDSVPFELGEIAATGKQGANGFLIRAVYNPTLYEDAENPVNAVPDNYLTTEGKAVSATSAIGQGLYTINQSGLKSAELLMAAMYNTVPTYHTVYVTYEGESTPVKYFAVSGYGTSDMKDKIYLVPQATYEGIRDGLGDAIMKLPNEYTLDEFKAIVGDDTLTKLPGNWKDYSEKYNEYLATTKYQQLKSSTDIITLASKETVDLKKLSANTTTTNVLLPTATQKFVPSQRVYTTSKVNKTDYSKTYTYKISVPLDPNKKVETIKIAGELRAPVDFVEESGGFAKVASNSTVHTAVMMLKYDGQNIVEFDGEKYYVFYDIQRECGTGALLGMTLVDNETLYDRYVELNDELKAINSEDLTRADCTTYRAKVSAMITESNNVLRESDFDFSNIKAAEDKFAEEDAAGNLGEIVKTAKRTNFPISEDTGANSKLFMLYDTSENSDYTKSATLDNYIIGIDYASSVKWSSESGDNYVYPTGVLETDKANSTGQYAFVYAIDSEEPTTKTTAEFITKDGKAVWTIDGVDYFVNPEEKVIQLFSTNKTDNITDANIAALFTNTMKGVTLDVVDGYYDKIGFLAAAGWGRTFSAVLNYEDGSKSSTLSYSVVKSSSNTVDKAAGNVALKTLATKSNALRLFQPCELEADPGKKLVSVKLTASTYHGENPVNIISAWGSTKTIEEKLAELGNIEITDKESLEAAKAALAEFDAFLEDLGYTLAHLGAYKEPYTTLSTQAEEFEKNADKNEALNKKYTQLEFVGPWDMFATGDDIKDANWKVTSTAAAPNILAYKGFAQSSSGNTQPSASNIYAFRADMIEGTNVEKNVDERYYINIGSVPFKLGEITTTPGTRGTNGWVPRGKLTPNTITEGLVPEIATTGDVTFSYGGSGYTTNIMKGTFNINNQNISAINFLTTGVYYGNANNRLYDVYVKYEGEEIEEHGFMFAGNLSQQVDEEVFAIPASEYDEIMADESLVNGMKEFSEYTVDEINALRGYTPTTSVDTSKTITSNNYTLAQFNEALGLNLVKFPTNWIKAKAKDESGTEVEDTTIYDIHKQIVAKTKYNAIVAGGVTLKSLSAGLDTTKLESAYEDSTVAIPTESSSFVKYRRGNWNTEYDTVVSNTKYPLDPNKKVESVRIEANLTDVKGDKGIAVGSGGAYSIEEYNTGRGVMMLNYNGQKTVNIGGTDYVLFMKVQRECGDSIFLGATYERKSTIQEEIDSINTRINAIDENTKVAEIVAIRENMESLKVESTYVTDTDFDLEKLVAAESTLSERKVLEATNAMTSITLESTIEEANAAKDLYDYALLDENVTESNFDANIVALFNQIHAKIADKTNLKGELKVKYFKGETPSADIVIENATKFAGKPYKVIFAYYDENDNILGTHIEDRVSVKEEKVSYTVKADKDFENATKVKGFIWKDFATLIPLSDTDETTKKDAFKVLSIGNSFSNNAHTYLGEIAQNAGFEKVIVENLYIGGCTLNTHYNNLIGNLPEYDLVRRELVDGKIKSTTTNDVTMLTGIIDEDWDVITIQQGSTFSGKPDSYTYLQKIIDYVNVNKTNKDAKIVWHQTWAYKEGSDALADRYNGMSQINMYNAIVNATQTEVLPLKDIDYVIPAGTAVQNARVPLGDIFNSDDIHLNNVGCYLIGLVWFEKITGISVDTITYTPNNPTITSNIAALKKAAKDALANPYEVTK